MDSVNRTTALFGLAGYAVGLVIGAFIPVAHKGPTIPLVISDQHVFVPGDLVLQDGSSLRNSVVYLNGHVDAHLKARLDGNVIVEDAGGDTK